MSGLAGWLAGERGRARRRAESEWLREVFPKSVGGRGLATSPTADERRAGSSAPLNVQVTRSTVHHISCGFAGQTVPSGGAVTLSSVAGAPETRRGFEAAQALFDAGTVVDVPVDISGVLQVEVDVDLLAGGAADGLTVVRTRGGVESDWTVADERSPRGRFAGSSANVCEVEAGDTVRLELDGADGESLAAGSVEWSLVRVEAPVADATSAVLWATGATSYPDGALVGVSGDGYAVTSVDDGSTYPLGGLAFDGTHLLGIDGNAELVRKFTTAGAAAGTLDISSTAWVTMNDATYLGGTIWVCDGGDEMVRKVNASTGSVTTGFAFTTDGGPLGITNDGTDLWISSYTSSPSVASHLTRVDTSGNTLQTIDLGGDPYGIFGLAFDGTDLWGVNAGDGTLYRITTAGVVAETITPTWSLAYGLGLTYTGA